MKKYLIIFLLFSIWIAPCLADDSSTTYDYVVKGKKCHESQPQPPMCEYTVGKDLHFLIMNVGKPDAAVAFIKSSFNGDFYATFDLESGCIIVKRGKKGIKSDNFIGEGSVTDNAFVCPRNGNIYKEQKECKESQ